MKRAVLIIAFIALAIAVAKGQQVVPSLAGTDFWVSFMRNSSRNAKCYILIASEHDCTARIENPFSGSDTTVFVPSGGINRVLVPDDQSDIPFGLSVANEAWHVVTDVPAIVYINNYLEYSSDMSAVLPTTALRCDYMTQTYTSNKEGPEVFIVAPYDSTRIRIIQKECVSAHVPDSYGSVFSSLYSPGDTIDTLLMRGQVCRMYSSCGSVSGVPSGFSGTMIHSSRPTAVFQGHRCAYVPASLTSNIRYGAGDVLLEQSVPVNYWGTHFLVIPTSGRHVANHAGPGGILVGDMVKVTSLRDSCVINIGGNTIGPLSSGESYSFVIGDHAATMPDDVNMDFYQSNALPIEASSPVSVFYYIGSCYFGGSPGDPASVVVPPIEQGISSSIIQIKNTQHTSNHYLAIVMPTGDVPMMRIDGVNVCSAFTPASNGFSYARMPVAEGTHILDADGGRFIAMVYGLGNTESYAFVAGMALRDTSYDVRASRHSLCVGDTVCISARHADSVLLDWSLDGRHMDVMGDTLRLSFDSVGRHVVTIATAPLAEPLCHCSTARDTVLEILTVNPSYNSYIEDNMCTNSIYQWNGQSLSSGGDYIASLVSSSGCDSVVNLHLTMAPVYMIETTGFVCPGDTLLWHDMTLTVEGTYVDTIQSVDACDTVASINLVFHSTGFDLDYDTVCEGESLLWRGRILLNEGVYTDSLTTSNGCDSIVSVMLSVAKAPSVVFAIEADCDNHHYNIHGYAVGDTVGYEYSWKSAPMDIALEGQPWDSLVLSPSQATEYRLSVNGRCAYDTIFTLKPVQWPVAQMRVQPERLSVDQPSFDAHDVSINADSRHWLVNGNYVGSTPVIHYTAHELGDSLRLTLAASNEACVDTLTIAIPIDNPEVWVPNAFTPEGADNNRFAPVLNECRAEGMDVYNRQGLLVAHIEGDNPSWDGTCSGTPCPQEAYVYVLYYRTDIEPQRLQKKVGTVLLLR